MADDKDDDQRRSEIAKLIARRCCNCFVKLAEFNSTHWVTVNVGPFCTYCYSEIVAAFQTDETEHTS